MTRIEWVRNTVTQPVLDVGCKESAYFDASFDYVAVDKDPSARAEQGERPNKFIEADAEDLPQDDDSFPTVLLAEILEHVDNPVAAISEAKRIATEQVVITVPDEARWLPDAKPGEHEDHQRYYTGKKLTDHCLEAGFNYEQVRIDHLNEFPYVFWLAVCKV